MKPYRLGADGRGWLRALAGFVVLFGGISTITLALFITHPCAHAKMDQGYMTCGVFRPALVVAVVTLLVAVLLGLAGKRRTG
jgi:hypothetical protein